MSFKFMIVSPLPGNGFLKLMVRHVYANLSRLATFVRHIIAYYRRASKHLRLTGAHPIRGLWRGLCVWTDAPSRGSAACSLLAYQDGDAIRPCGGKWTAPS